MGRTKETWRHKFNALKKPGKEYTSVQLKALERKAKGLTISDVKAANTKSMKDKARERNKKFNEKKEFNKKLKIAKNKGNKLLGPGKSTTGKAVEKKKWWQPSNKGSKGRSR